MDAQRTSKANTPECSPAHLENGISIEAQGTVLAGIVLAMCLSFIGALFWYSDWVYQLPTPIPPGYQTVEPGSPIDLGEWKGSGFGKPVFLHFFNPNCPCSRFNVSEVKALIRDYGAQVEFTVVVMRPHGDDSLPDADIRDEFGPEVGISFDERLALSCGVYSTPQAVIIDGQGRLFYRGNYNKNRYCTARRTNYARIALDALLNGETAGPRDITARVSYGCELPGCRKK